MLDKFFFDTAELLFGSPNRTFITFWVTVFVCAAIALLCAFSDKILRISIAFLATNAFLFIPLFSFPSLLVNFYTSLGLIDEFATVPYVLKMSVLFPALTISLTLLIGSIIIVRDLYSSRKINGKTREQIIQQIHEDLYKEREHLRSL